MGCKSLSKTKLIEMRSLQKYFTFAFLLANTTANEPNMLFVDSSDRGYGAVYKQLDRNNVRQSTYMYGKWSSKDLNLKSTEKELKIVYKALVHFRKHIRGKSVLIKSDCSVIVRYLSAKIVHRKTNLSRLTARCLNVIARNFVSMRIDHIAGKINIEADFLSRLACKNFKYPISEHYKRIITI